MIQLYGSWVAMPTPFTENDKIDFNDFEILIDRQTKHETSQIFALGSAGEMILLTSEEEKIIVHEVIKIVNGRIPVFFSAASMTTQASTDFAQHYEKEGVDGVIFTVPPYVLINQIATFIHMDTCMSSVSIPCGIYNNLLRLGV